MKALPGSLRWRLCLQHLLIMAAILSSAGILVYTQVQSRLIGNRLGQAREIVSWALTSTEPSGSLTVSDMNEATEKLSTTPAPDFSFFLLDTGGELVRPLGQGRPRFTKVPLSFSDLSHATTGEPVKSIVVKAIGDEYRTLVAIWVILEEGGSVAGAVQSAVRLDEADMALSRLARTLAAGFLLLFVVASGLWLLLVNAVLRPLEQVARVSGAIAAGNLEHRIPVPRIRDETYHTAVAFNQMLDRLRAHVSREEEMRSRMQRFLADAAHELRTPLTALTGYVDVLRRGAKDDPTTLQNVLEAMSTTLGKTARLTSDLLSLARLDLGTELSTEVVELNSICRSAIRTVQIIANGRQLGFQSGAAASIRGDAYLLELALWNLLNNSIRHTNTNGKIVVGVSCQGRHAHVTVQDDGEGIPAEHLPRIFDRFYRVDPARPGGSGLGLAIVKAIVELHNGSIAAQSVPGHGTIFTIILPLEVGARPDVPP